MRHFSDRVIVVTGASSGIGKALCLELASQRPKLVLAARDVQRLEAVGRQCESLGAEVLIAPTDVTVEADCKRLAGQTAERFGRLDVLVNNAGRAMWSRFDELQDLRVIEDVMRLNYLGSVAATYYALPLLKQSAGLVVAMASVAGLTGAPLLSGYAASKHAVIGFFESLRIELKSNGVGVTIVAPDWVQSEILDRALDSGGKPLDHSPMDQTKLMTAERCARRIIMGMSRRERLVLLTGRSKNLRIGKLLVPWLVDRMVASTIQRR